jgi:hypothetical protein
MISEEEKKLAKEARYRMWLAGVKRFAEQHNVDVKQLLNILESNWEQTVYGWDESDDFIFKLGNGGFYR